MSSSSSESVDDLRQQGNYQFQQSNYDAAISLYTAALELIPPSGATTDDDERVSSTNLRSILLCNRSACWYQLQQYEAACQDAREAMGPQDNSSNTYVRIDNLKATYRLAKTLIAMEDYTSSKELIQQAMNVLDGAITTRTSNVESILSPSPQPLSSYIPSLEDQKKSFRDLYQSLLEAALTRKPSPEPTTVAAIVQHRTLSIREFSKGEELGYGNFSQILVVTHKATNERFALKLIEKKQAADLAKRQHPNVYNEIQMERRVLLERVPPHPNLIRMFSAFQDYTTIYYLMELCDGDLWSELKWRGKLVGCHATQARHWMYQLVDAVEHLHSFGIVHRDIKPENILLRRSQVVLIDLGTAKDLVQSDLNGPEFVGTPDFMSPEAVNGNSMEQDDTVDASADLWALGAVLYILTTGKTPFWSPSPYLAFLRIKRCNLTRDAGIYDDATWDLIQRLMQKDPSKRLGADAFQVKVDGGIRRMYPQSGGYDCIRQHAYFRNLDRSVEVPHPSLVDLCYRAVAEQVEHESQNLVLCDEHPPGDKSSHDMMRLKPQDRAAILHLLDRLMLLRDARLYARFFTDPVSLLLSKVRPVTRDFVGLTQMNDDGYKPPKATMNDPYSKPVEDTTIEFVHWTCSLFHDIPSTDAMRKEWTKVAKMCLYNINQNRPRLVVATGTRLIEGETCLKLLARISDSIPVVVVNGSSFFNFWWRGVECIALAQKDQGGLEKDESPQVSWIRERVEQSRLSKHPLFVFCAEDPHGLPTQAVKRLVRGRALALYGPSSSKGSQTIHVTYHANEKVDDVSVRSDSSEEDEQRDCFTSQITSTLESGLRWITVQEDSPDDWHDRFQGITFGD